MSKLTVDDLVVGNVYSAKRRKSVGFVEPLINDRQIVYINRLTKKVQYDSPTVKFGRKLPFVDIEKFLNWADKDVTAEMPKGEWRIG